MLATLTAAALLGAASSAHCITMCGPLVVAGCSRGGGVRTTAAYIAGRFVSYGAIGALAGGIGGPVVVAAASSREVRIVIGFLLAASIAIAAIRFMRPKAPKLVRLSRKPFPPSRLSLMLARFVPARGLGLGLATGLFPCGALASALLVAAASGTPLGGGLSMFAFAAASAPALVMTALFGDRAVQWLAAQAWLKRIRPAGGIVLLGLAGWLALGPWLAGHHESGGATCACEAEASSR